jgi:hypothetical protein
MSMHDTNRSNDAAAESPRRIDWLPDSLLSGFVATIIMSVMIAGAYVVALALGQEGGNQLERWLWALSHNPVTETTTDAIALAIALNLVMGMVWALVYAYAVEPRLSGPPWRKGILFALVPWVLSVVAFLPIMGGGFLGSSIDAGPLPVLGNLLLHLVYGATLGAVYALDLDAWLDDTEVDRAHAIAAERGAIYGILIGTLGGAVLGFLVGPQIEELGGRGLVTLAGALLGSAVGGLVGSFTAMDRQPSSTGRHTAPNA